MANEQELNQPRQPSELAAALAQAAGLDPSTVLACTDEQLIQEVINNNSQVALEHLWRRYGRYVKWAIRHAGLGDQDAAEDVFQAVWVRFCQQLCEKTFTYRGEEALRGWLIHLVKWEVQNELRRKPRRPRSFSDLSRTTKEGTTSPLDQVADHGAAPDTESREEETRLLLQEAVGTLSPECQAVFQLIYREGRKFKEVAELLGLPIGTVASRSALLKQQLAAYFEEKRLSLDGDGDFFTL